MARGFNPGRFRHKIYFLKRSVNEDGTTPTDDYGEPLDLWEVFRGAMASKEPILGNEFFSALTTDNKVEVKFNTRYIKGITSEMRIRHGDEIYEIIGPPINVKSENKELLCYCRMMH